MRKQGKLSLEDYVAFQENPATVDLTVHQLNQIIGMHGFKKLHHRHKVILLEAARSINLIPPPRSTLNESVCFVPLTLEEVKEDLDSLDWKECPVQSIHTLKHDLTTTLGSPLPIGGAGASYTPNNNASTAPPICASSTSCIPPLPCSPKGPKSSSKRKRRPIKSLLSALPCSHIAPA